MLMGLLLVAGIYGVLTYDAYKSSLKPVREAVYMRAGKKNKLRVHDYIFQIEDVVKFKVRREMVNKGIITPDVLGTIIDNAILLSAGVESEKSFSFTDETASNISKVVLEDYEING